MATREEMSRKIRQDLADRGITSVDPGFQFALLALEDMNQGVADLDDELADIAARLSWLAQAPTWINSRKLEEFDSFVDAQITACDAGLTAVRARWGRHRTEQVRERPSESRQ